MLIVEIDRKAVTGAKDFEKAFANRPDKPVLLLVKDAQGLPLRGHRHEEVAGTT